jgi:hypothetical protein
MAVAALLAVTSFAFGDILHVTTEELNLTSSVKNDSVAPEATGTALYWLQATADDQYSGGQGDMCNAVLPAGGSGNTVLLTLTSSHPTLVASPAAVEIEGCGVENGVRVSYSVAQDACTSNDDIPVTLTPTVAGGIATRTSSPASPGST